MEATVNVPATVLAKILQHLRKSNANEEACFLFASSALEEQRLTLNYLDWIPIGRKEFAFQSDYHIEVDDRTIAAIIKRAHDLGCSLIEMHSHTGPWRAQFSPSDFAGFAEFVPHIWWRLRGKPYAAVVVTENGFDGLVWVESPQAPIGLTRIETESQRFVPTGLSITQR
jgi:hypothetical protein